MENIQILIGAKMKKQLFISLINIIGILVITGCAAAYVDGPYEGRVIDADTGQPVEGVVVLGIWNTVIVTPGGGTHNFYDAQETVTDKNGDFKIKGLGLVIMSNISPLDVLIFKAGYEQLINGPWASLKMDLLLRKIIKWEGIKAIIPLRKLSMDERRKLHSPSFSSQIPEAKMRLMLEEINKDRVERGLDPYRLRGGNNV